MAGIVFKGHPRSPNPEIDDQTARQQLPLLPSAVIDALRAERAKQREKFGQEPLANEFQLIAILGEEFGEICEAICQAKGKEQRDKEVRQLAAVCCAWLQGDLHWSTKP